MWVTGFYFMKKFKGIGIAKLALIFAIFLSTALTASLTALTASMLRAGANISTLSDFNYEDNNGHIFKCYHRESLPGEVEIGWGGDVSEQIDTLNVPETVSDGHTNYTVTAVVQGGFRYCQFRKINLPGTITHIEEEAFAYCTRLEEFVLPYHVTEIKPSTFIDCRAMLHFFYNDSSHNVVVTNSKVTSIGDHAFDSCISLTDFTCSTVLTHFGYSCFQNCEALSRFYFPSKTGTGSNINNITVESYAFADCENLTWVYFESNLSEVDDYAFVNCHTDMVFHYGYEGTYPGDPTYQPMWRRKRLSSNTTNIYPIEGDHIVILQSNEYPGLKYTIENVDRYLDADKDGRQVIKIIDHNDGKYAVIYQWNAPIITVANYYNVVTKALEIPGSLTFDGVDYPLKVINTETFANHASDIKSVKFNNGLVQICKRAFYKCNEIESLDFSQCDTLKEISNDIFNHKNSGTVNNVMTTLTLPNSLEFIGKYAFYAFRKIEYLSFKTHADQSCNLKTLAGFSFGRIGEYYTEPKIDIVLPCTLNDTYAVQANINYEEGDYNSTNFAAIAAYCFGASVNGQYSAVKRITMEPCTHAHASDMSWRCSVAPNAFNRAKYLTKFVANDNMCLVGNEAFKNCESLREIFLTTTKAAATGYPVPFGTDKANGSAFKESIISGASNSKALECVIYLDGNAPGNINTLSGVDAIYWNAEKSVTYATDFGYTSGATADSNYEWTHSRSAIPTIYNTDFNFNSGSILYYKPSTGTFLDEAPSTLTDYNSGIIVFAKAKNSDNYTVVRYFTDDSHVTKEIDLSQIVHPTLGNISSKITAIGPEAFAKSDGSRKSGYYFILPDSVTTIDERAFFHKANNSKKADLAVNGVRLVTYRDHTTGDIQPSNSVYSSTVSTCNSNDNNDNNRYNNIIGYCNLPSAVNHIGRNAFYNNLFGTVTINGSLSFLGKSAFYSQPDTSGKNGRSKLSTITMAANSNFNVVNGGIYYTGTNSMLLYQAQNITGTLTIPSGTKAVAMSGCAGTSYNKITINNDMKTIYGAGFQHNIKLTEIEGGTGLKYIGGYEPDDEVYDATMPFDNIDYRNRYDSGVRGKKASSLAAFQDNPVLATVNFKAMTSLEKIGHAAFRNCANLEQCAGGDSYSYYSYNGSTSLIETVSTGVLDLSPCTSLRVIGRDCFTSKKIKYVHLPATNGSLSVGRDATDFPWFSNDGNGGAIFSGHTPAFLVGDNADHTYTSVTYTWAYKNARNRWSTIWYGKSDVYYHVSSAADILTSGVVSAVKYWTEKPGGGYILFTDQANAQSYFA